jgi:Carboxypeptidase regulatory-like domain
MKNNKFLVMLLMFLGALTIGCDSRNEQELAYEFTFGNEVTRNFSGKVVDVNHNPISNVAITMAGLNTTTNANGEFTLNNVPCKERFAHVTAVKEGYLSGSRVTMPHDGINKMEIMLLPMNVVATIPSGQTSNVIIPQDNIKITFDGSFMTENGAAYNGNVDIIVNHLAANDPDVFIKMPGNLIGTRTDGTISGMETYGMINVEMRGDNGEKIQIANGHKAELVLPIAENQLDDAPATIPLWHFNETSGLWEEQGFSRRVGNKYYGSVSHFSWWNNDSAYVVATLYVTVKNSDGSPVNGVRVTITRQAGSTGDVLMNLGVTGANGTLSAGVPRNELLIFRAYNAQGILINQQVLPPSPDLQRYVDVIIPTVDRTNGNVKK